MTHGSALPVLQILRQQRILFFDRLAELSLEKDEQHIVRLRQDTIYNVVEYLFILSNFDLTDQAVFVNYLQLHNNHIQGLLDCRDKQQRMGLTVDRLDKGVFSERALMKTAANFATSDGAVDQSDLARLMITLVSPETCRRSIEVLEVSGFLTRTISPFGSMLVKSKGTAEAEFELMLSNMEREIQSLSGGKN